MLKTSSTVLLWTSMGLIVLASANSDKATFSESCEKHSDCDRNAFLDCVHGTCQCKHQECMTFDPDQETCLVFAGRPCVLPAAGKGNLELECVKNARCPVIHDEITSELAAGSGTLCHCDENHVEKEGFCLPKGSIGKGCTEDKRCQHETEYCHDGTCTKKLKRGEKCTRNEQCSGRDLLACVDGICNCNRKESVDDPSLKKCVRVAGAYFSFGVEGQVVWRNDCGKNSHPEREVWRRRHGATRWTERCVCDPGYEPKEGLCRPSYGAAHRDNREMPLPREGSPEGSQDKFA